MRFGPSLLLCGLLAAVPAPGILPAQARSSIIGVVVSGRTLQPVRGARVRLIHLASDTIRTALSDSLGRFAFVKLMAGHYSIEALFAQDRSVPSVMLLRDRERVEVEFKVDPPRLGDSTVAVLPELAVEAAPGGLLLERGFLGEREFRERMKSGGGQYLTRDEVLERHPPSFFDLLRTMRGVQVACSRGVCTPRMTRVRRGCVPQVVLDGMHADVDAARGIQPNEVEGIEVYTGLSQAPMQYVKDTPGAPCGLIIVWTRHGPPRRPGG